MTIGIAIHGESYLKWLIDWRTASSNSIGPGMSKVGCDILTVSFESVELVFNLLTCWFGEMTVSRY
jgi:hypothetical protein